MICSQHKDYDHSHIYFLKRFYNTVDKFSDLKVFYFLKRPCITTEADGISSVKLYAAEVIESFSDVGI